MADNSIMETKYDPLIPRYFVSITTFICAGIFVLLALMGPLGFGNTTLPHLGREACTHAVMISG